MLFNKKFIVGRILFILVESKILPFFIGTFKSGTSIGTVTHWESMPRTLAPVPQVGDEKYNNALYIPKGRALWGARNSSTNLSDGPLLGCQGGWY